MTAPETDRPVVPVPVRQVRRLSLVRLPAPVGKSRDFARQAMTEWQWSVDTPDGEEVVEDVLLVVSELVANATAHGGGATEIALALDGPQLTVSVADADPAEPAPRPADPSCPGGHGLHVVARLATDWGSTPRPAGKTVWATFHA